MNLKKLIVILVITPFILFQSTATTKSTHDPVKLSKAQLVSPFQSLPLSKPGKIEIPIGIYIHLKKGWHSYWKQPGESGKALTVKWTLPKGATIDSLSWPFPEKFTAGFVPILTNKANKLQAKKPLISFGYKKSFLLYTTLHLPNQYIKTTSTSKTAMQKIQPIKISAEVDWLICKELCIPFNQHLNLSLKSDTQIKKNIHWEKVFNDTLKKIPKPLDKTFPIKLQNTHWMAKVTSEWPGQLLNIFPLSLKKFSTEAPEILYTNTQQHHFKIKKAKTYSNTEKQTKAVLVFKEKNKTTKTAYLFTFEEHRKSVFWFLLLAFLGGFILNLMPCVLPIVFLKFSNTLEQIEKKPKAVVLSNIFYSLGVITSFLALAFLLIGLKTAGESIGWGFQMQSPYFLISITLLFTLISFNFMGWLSITLPSFAFFHRGTEYFKSFLTGGLSTTAASPCTVPFMGAAIGYALSGGTLDVILIFFFLGLGMSSPYLLLSIFPKWIQYAPHPGAWSEKLKHFMAFPMLATTAWLIHLLNRQQPDTLLPLLLSLLLLAFGFYLMNNTQRKWIKRLSKVLIILAGMSAFWSYSLYKKTESLSNAQIEWQTFSSAKLHQLRSQGKPVFINFTADWCLTCKWNEQIAFKNKKVVQLFKNLKIQALKGDWTHKNQEITDILDSYSRSGIPFYLYFPERVNSEGFIMPEWLTPGLLIQEMKKIK